MRNHSIRQLYLLVGLLFLFSPNLTVARIVLGSPSISIIIDDIGYRIHEDLRAIALPGSIAYAIMPHSPNAQLMSRLASKRGKVILLHLPMESIWEEKNRFLGPGALTLNMTHDQFMRTLVGDLRSIPDAVGVNNHMGSLLTQHPGNMGWLMDTLKKNKKFYIDSVTSTQSVAGTVAGEKKIPYLRRDVFLDNHQNEAYIQAQFEELIKIAKQKGHAIAIGHPYPETLQVLSIKLQQLDEYGVVLVNLVDMVDRQNEARKIRHTLLSHK
ncbi:MAG: divergent polysaccharide deacetylase family protein [Gammaproteobacteria bacterium]